MANTNNFFYKSLADLKKLAESYNTTTISGIEGKTDPVYIIDDLSKDEFENITNFLYNAVIKDSKLIDSNETEYSQEFYSYLKKYFDEELSLRDVIDLKLLVNKYNKISFNYLYNNIYKYVYGLSTGAIDQTGFLGKMSGIVKDKLSYLVSNMANPEERYPVKYWMTGEIDLVNAINMNVGTTYKIINLGTAEGNWTTVGASVAAVGHIFTKNANNFLGPLDAFVTTGPFFNALEFYNTYFLKSNTIEAIVTLLIISYVSSSGSGIFKSTDTTTATRGPETYDSETYVVSNQLLNLLETKVKDFTFNVETASLTTRNLDLTGDTRVSEVVIQDSFGNKILSLPQNLISGTPGSVVESYNFIPFAGGQTTITYLNLFIYLKNSLLNFVNKVKDTQNTLSDYRLYLEYFIENSTVKVISNLSNDVKEIARVFYEKDAILDNAYISTGEAEKRSAIQLEINNMQALEQIMFIDLKGLDYTNDENLQTARSLFNLQLLGTSVVNPEDADQGLPWKLTYTVLYKELNPVLRSLCLTDIQEYVFARLLSSYSHNKRFFFENNRRGLSYLDSVNTLYRGYSEKREAFLVDPSFNRYKFFRNNVYMARVSNESDMIGYYVGDNSPDSLFINNYGFLDYQKVEIGNFIDIYKTSRDYYYKVLLNKSFIHDDTYSLFEKMYISWIAVERFVSYKIEGLKDPESYNSTDIFNFLESYGLGILNQYDFFLGSRDYKVNIIKNFNKLTRLKGSKDVISLLGETFDTGDVLVDLNKFLLVDSASNTYDETDTVQLSTILNDSKYYIAFGQAPSGTGTGILIYDISRIYYVNNSFRLWSSTSQLGTTALTPSINQYFFDDENYKLYQWGTVSGVTKLYEKILNKVDHFNNRYVSGQFYIRESSSGIVIKDSNGDNISLTGNISVVNTLPEIMKPKNVFTKTSGDIFYSTSESKFYERLQNGWELLKVSDFYPSVLKDNVNKSIAIGSSTMEKLRSYNNYTFYVRNEIGVITNLYRYSNLTNSLINLPFKTRAELPRVPGIINVPFWRPLLRGGYITFDQLEKYNPMLYRTESNLKQSNKVFLDIKGYVNNYFDYIIKLTPPTYVYIQRNTVLNESSLKLVEIPYPKTGDSRSPESNETREILNQINSSVQYESFLQRNDSEGIDPYWTRENAPESLLKSFNINAVETKYLSLTISENIYRKYAIARYALSSIEYLEGKFVIPETTGSVVSRIKINTGANLLGDEVSIYDLFQAIKIMFKSLLKIYSVRNNDLSVPKASSSFNKYYGINANNWSNTYDILERLVPSFSRNSSVFAKDLVKQNNTSDWTGLTPYNKFNIFEKTNDAVTFDNVNYYRKDLVSNDAKVFNETANAIYYSLFSTHGIDREKEQENSGAFTIDLFENLNTIRIETATNLWNYFLSKYRDINYVQSLDLGSQFDDKLPNQQELYSKIIEGMMRFPIQYFDGILYPTFIQENINLTKDFVDLATTIFTDVYTVPGNKIWLPLNVLMSESAPANPKRGDYWLDGTTLKVRNDENNLWLSLSFTSGSSNPGTVTINTYFKNTTSDKFFYGTTEDPAFFTKTSFEAGSTIQTYLNEALSILAGTFSFPLNNSDMDELIQSYSEKLITLLSSLESIFSSEEFLKFSFSLRQNEQQTLGFVETAIKIFLSYTAQLYSSSYKREYRTDSESAALSETVKHFLNSNRVDLVFYDEKLDIKKED